MNDCKHKENWEILEQKRELERQIKLEERLKKAREETDELYAVKLVEKAVFAIIALMAMTIAGALLKIAIEYINVHFSK